ncbi:MAG TPA: S9 family peptidase [Steroidobacteraceae bacterium]|nr:S9 family peptidase [Steroidobacteraceae bacterium]
MRKGWRIAMACMAGVTFLEVSQGATPSAEDRLVHRFLHVEISPDGTFVASVEGDSPVNGSSPPLRELVIRGVKNGAVTRIAVPCGHVPQCWPGSPAWSADNRHLSFTLRRPGSHSYGVYTVSSDGSDLSKQIDFEGTVVDLRYMTDGRLSMLATEGARKEVGATEAGAAVAGDLDEAPPEQRIAILADGAVHWASPPDLFVYEYDWRPDGKGFVGTASPGDGDNNWWTAKLYAFNAADGAAQVIYSPTDIQQQIALPKVSRDGATVAFIAGIMSDFGSTGGDVYTLPLAGGQPTNITPGRPASARSLFWNCKNRLMSQELASEKSQLVDLGTGRQPAPGRVLWSGIETLARGDASVSLACPSGLMATFHESFTSPPEIATGTGAQWKDLTAVNAGLKTPARVQSLQWISDGFTVQGWLLLPEHVDGKLPLITTIHGGPAGATLPLFRGPGLQQTLLERGYAVFYPNPRGSFGQGERFTAANVHDFGYGDLRDVLAGVDAAEKVAPIDDARLGITGGSYGGFMTMWAVTQTHRFKAAVASAGLSNWLSYYGENGIDGWMLPYFGASVYKDPAVYAKSSPINFISNVRTPTFAYVGERDIECPAPQTQEFWHALKSLGVPTSVMIYPGEGHRLREPEHAADAMRRTLEWFDKYLK